MYGPQAAFLSELFGTRVRYSGASLGYQRAPLSGGLAPLIAAGLLDYYEGELARGDLLDCHGGDHDLAVWFAAETNRRELGNE